MTLRKQFSLSNKVIIDREAFERLKELVIKAYPDEACGILLGDAGHSYVKETWPMENATKDDSHWYFQADPLELYRLELRAEIEGKGILGFYHSHPDVHAKFSLEDERFFIPGNLYLILSVDHDRVEMVRAYQKETLNGETLEIKVEMEERE